MQSIKCGEVTVAICVRNGERYIGEAISSAQSQLSEPSQVLVIDDGSSDSSADIAKHMGCEVIRQGSRSLGAARNNAFRSANSRWVYFLDSDDLIPKNALKALLTQARSMPSVHGINGFRKNFVSRELTKDLRLNDEKFLEPELSPLPSGSLWRKQLGETNKFNEESKTTDIEWIMGLRAKNTPIASIQSTVLLRRIHLDNASSTPEYKRAYLDLAIRKMRVATE